MEKPVKAEKAARGRGLLPLTEMEALFEGFFKKPFSLLPWTSLERFGAKELMSPSVDMFEEGGKLVVHAELPGLTRDDVEVSVTDDIITIKGEKKKETKVERENYYRAECEYGSFTRRLPLPQGADSQAVDATFRDGVLTVTIPKVEIPEEEGRKIEIH